MDNSEQHRRDCEARFVMAMGRDRREAFYQGVFKERGRDAANQLIEDVNNIRRKAKEAVK